MPSDDLLDHAKSTTDYYATLGPDLHSASTQKELSRAYRLASLKVHPDKNKSVDAVAKFHALTIAYEVLSDETAKAVYDAARLAREARKRQDDLFRGKRRQMKEELEAGERAAFGAKRRRRTTTTGSEDEGEAREREIKRLAEEGRRRRLEKEEALRKAREEEQRREREQEEGVHPQTAPTTTSHTQDNGSSTVPEADRTVKVRWPREGRGLTIDKDELTSLFATFGPIEMVIVLKDKKVRPTLGGTDDESMLGSESPASTPSKQKKRLMATGVVVYKSIVGAHAAVLDFRKQIGETWSVIESVEWRGKEPDLGFVDGNGVDASNGVAGTPNSQRHESPASATVLNDNHPSTPPPSLHERMKKFQQRHTNSPTTTTSTTDDPTTNPLRKVPSFASFKKPPPTPHQSTPSKLNGESTFGTPSFEETTLMRMKAFERRRVEGEIRAREAREGGGGGVGDGEGV